MRSEGHQRAIIGHSVGNHAHQRTWDSSSTTSTSWPESSPPTSRCLMTEAIRGLSVAIRGSSVAIEVYSVAITVHSVAIRPVLRVPTAGLDQHAISMQSAHNQHTISMPSDLCCASQRRLSIPQATGMAPSLC